MSNDEDTKSSNDDESKDGYDSNGFETKEESPKFSKGTLPKGF